MDIKHLIRAALFYISVPKCVLCKEKLSLYDRGLCSSCRDIYEFHKTRNCSRCARELIRCSCSNKYLKSHSVKKHLKIFKYLHTEQAAPGNNLIYSLKQEYREDVIDFLADELVECVKNNIQLINTEQYIITNIPRRKAAIVKFGYDHTEVLAKSVASKLNIRYMKLLKSKSKKAQKEVRGIDRLTNVNFDYISNKSIDLKGKTALIIDDIITTGASMGACALLIRALGVRECIALTVASAYNDEYVKRV